MLNSKKLSGLFRGKVLRHLPHGKLKVWIPGVYSQNSVSSPESLPTAEIMTPIFGGNLCSNGVFSYPNVGSIVICTFLNGDQNLPIVLGTTQGSDFSKWRYKDCFSLDQTISDDDLDNKTDKTAFIHEINIGKTRVQFNEGGEIDITVNGTNGSSSIILDTDGNMMLQCSGVFQVKADTINMMSTNSSGYYSCKDMSIVAGNTNYQNAQDILIEANTNKVTLKSPKTTTGFQI